jgi:cyclohexanecarboxylate-CoA ligase
MKLRATYRAPDAGRYRAPGGAWDVPVLDSVMRQRPPGTGAVLVDGDRRFDGPQLENLVAGLAGGLRSMGVRRGDVVTWQMPNWWEALVLYRACWRCGAVAAPLHHQFGAAEVDYMVELLEPTVAFSSPVLPLAEREGTIAVRAEGSRFDELLAANPVHPAPASPAPTLTPTPTAAAPNHPADLAVVIFTSGSTGRPKAVLHTHRGLAYKAQKMTAVHGLSSADAVLMPAPLAHISGLLNAVLVPGAAAMRVVLMDRWDVGRGLSLMEQERISYMIGPPTMFTAVMEDADFAPSKVASLRVISSGMMGVSPAFIAAAREGLGAIVKRSYGSTEAPTVSTCTNDDPPERCQETDGRAVGDVVIRITDPVTGRARPTGQEGEVWIRGPELFAGYSDAAETAASMHRGWFRSGDLGVVDDQGWLAITGRIKELIIRGGENISSSEVERALELHPGIRQAVVVGRPDERLGERVVAFIVGTGAGTGTRTGAGAGGPAGSDVIDVAECRRWFAEHGVARFKTPELVVQLDEVPLLAAGKPDRTALKARAATLSMAG